MLLLAFLALQATPPPDIEIDLHATVREVRIERRGETSLEVHAEPDADSRVTVARPEENRNTNRNANRSTRARNATVDVHAEARIADPAANLRPSETTPPQ